MAKAPKPAPEEKIAAVEQAAQIAQADPGDETDTQPDPDLAVQPDPLPDPAPLPDPVPGAFPSLDLMLGHRARRASWAAGYELMATNAGGRSGARIKLMTTGSRGGPIEWTPQHLADELLAQDWLVVPAVEPLP